MESRIFLPSEILLPKKDVDLGKWAVLACDQYTSQPSYWQQVEEVSKGTPSTLQMILPEVYLEQEGTEEKVAQIHNAMNGYLKDILLQKIDGFIYLERRMQNGAIRQGLLGKVDLEAYSYKKGENPRIRPSEETVVDRIPPRLAIRRDASVEAPHILMLIDDPEKTVIEPVGEQKNHLKQLYDQELMLDGGQIQGWAVCGDEFEESIQKALENLETSEIFHKRYDKGKTSKPFIMALGDGNHSFASAKAWWEELKSTLTPEEQINHPARYCLVELENIQSPAIEIEPIHRVVFNVKPEKLIKYLEDFVQEVGAKLTCEAQQNYTFRTMCNGEIKSYYLENSPFPLTVGFLDRMIEKYAKENQELQVDYVHGEKAVEELSMGNALGFLLPPFEKGDLFKGIALGGVLPKKTFSMGHASEKRYYLECRKIRNDRV